MLEIREDSTEEDFKKKGRVKVFLDINRFSYPFFFPLFYTHFLVKYYVSKHVNKVY